MKAAKRRLGIGVPRRGYCLPSLPQAAGASIVHVSLLGPPSLAALPETLVHFVARRRLGAVVFGEKVLVVLIDLALLLLGERVAAAFTGHGGVFDGGSRRRVLGAFQRLAAAGAALRASVLAPLLACPG